ncbi:hypothetical protein CVD28_00920 [Bacillus sp. M6-12]|uniref:hypothetical protein n=1 Tax=Bacillus sp. M6-12 TaxID=2054166 RepID=UPI000C788B78|nr:hypothetical protein [Bacillus sp. M6-12]PLS18995.1 hypothetical protein CVD28_00920 [Bacillus sp. M6-12]
MKDSEIRKKWLLVGFVLFFMDELFYSISDLSYLTFLVPELIVFVPLFLLTRSKHRKRKLISLYLLTAYFTFYLGLSIAGFLVPYVEIWSGNDALLQGHNVWIVFTINLLTKSLIFIATTLLSILGMQEISATHKQKKQSNQENH